MEVRDIGYVCPNCKCTFEMPRWVIADMYKIIMSYSPIPKEELELFKQLKDLKVIFDVGARDDTNYLELWPEAEHHLFEPNPEFFEVLSEKVKDKPNVFANNFGLGDKKEDRGYHKYLQGFSGSGAVGDNTNLEWKLPLNTLGWYIEEKGIKQIDFLKIDTEGFDLKVLIGAYNWLGMIKFIQYEHWGEHNNKMTIGLLQDDFEIHNVGYRNMFCMNRKLVSEDERAELREYIVNNKLCELV